MKSSGMVRVQYEHGCVGQLHCDYCGRAIKPERAMYYNYVLCAKKALDCEK